MKKWILLAIIIVSLIIGLSNDLIEKDLGKTDYNPALELLSEGKMDDIEFGIGTKCDKIVAQWGEPDEYDESFMGGTLFQYSDTYFLIGINQVTGIYYTGSNKIYGVHVGMELQQVEEALGKPTNSYESVYSELYINEPLILAYNVDKYVVNFEISTENKVASIFIFQDLME